MKLKVIVEAQVNITEILKALTEYAIVNLLHKPYQVYSLNDIDINTDANFITTEYDTSYHGSPCYETQVLTEDANKVKMIKAIKDLQEAYLEYEKANV